MNEQSGQMNEDASAAAGSQAVDTAQALNLLEETAEEVMEAADVKRVFGEPIRQNGSVIIPVAEVSSGMGFGGGFGKSLARKAGMSRMQKSGVAAQGSEEKVGAPEEGGGIGGGGRVSAKPMAVIIADSNGVRVEPIINQTRIALTAIIASSLSIFMLIRLMRKTVI